MVNKEKLIDIVEKEFNQKKVLVLGDLMVDEYITGKVSRISDRKSVV